MLDPTATRQAPWLAEPRRLWSLLDMIEFLGGSFLSTHTLLQEANNYMQLCSGLQITPLETSGEKRGEPLEIGPGVELTKDQRRWVAHIAESAEQASAAIGLSDCALLANGLHWRLTGPQSCTYDRAQSELHSILTLMSVGLSKQRFAFVPPRLQEYLEEGNLLQIARPSPMPELDQDVRDAGNCIAMQLYTAAVFHLMRAAEHGVRKLAADIGVTLPKRPSLEDADWTELIDGLAKKSGALAAAGAMRASPEMKEIERLNALTLEARTLKDYRNPTMHCRRVYSEPEALAILLHVREFIQRMTPQ